MNPFDPMGLFRLEGEATVRNVTLAWPKDVVRKLLPTGAELGPQDMTPEGTHPVILSFNDISKLRLRMPSLIPSQSYLELIVGIPYTYVSSGASNGRGPGPYYYMPRIVLDNVLATVSGLAFWGFPKRRGAFSNDGVTYAARQNGLRIVSVTMSDIGPPKPVDDLKHFTQQLEALTQPLLTRMPVGIGPFFAILDFTKDWERARIRSMKTVVNIFSDFYKGIPVGRFPEEGNTPGIDESIIGSYELSAPIKISPPYPPGL